MVAISYIQKINDRSKGGAASEIFTSKVADEVTII